MRDVSKERLLGVEGAAEFLGRTPHAVYRLVARRRLPFRKDGRRVLFRESELVAYVDGLSGTSLEEALANAASDR